MSTTLTRGNSIIVDTPETAPLQAMMQSLEGQDLISWITGRTNAWRDHRDRGYSRRWQEYWRLWRGRWSQEDKNRQSERSRLIAPALAQAIESTVAEIEEGTLAKDQWIDIADDLGDQDPSDAAAARDILLEDLGITNTKDVLSEVALNGAIFGTGIAKLNVTVETASNPVRDPNTGQLIVVDEQVVRVYHTSIRPDEFIPDPAGKSLDQMLGFAHEMTVPTHSVLEKIETGVYRKSALPHIHAKSPTTTGAEVDAQDIETMFSTADSTSTDILEYHGKVPLNMLNQLEKVTTQIDSLLDMDLTVNPALGDGPLVEAIVTIANKGILLRATVTPFVMRDRSFVAYQHEKVPGRFWGRGVAEKGYNPQKALDAEVRSRIDALGFISAPMLGVDSGRIPRGFKMDVRPGKVWLTQGDPHTVLRPIELGAMNSATFNQASEMERMVQMGTGAFDTAGAIGQQSQSGANAASSNSLMMGAFVKRSKRAIQNFSRNLLNPLIKKTLWRYMQFSPQRYPSDFKFRAVAGTGIVAREVEAMQLTQLLGMLPQEFPEVSVVVAKGIVDSSAVFNKKEINAAIDSALQPPPPEVQQRQKELEDAQFQAVLAEAQGKLLQNQKTLAEIREILSKSEVNARKADTEDVKVQQEQQRIALQAEEIEQFQQQNQIALKRLQQQDRALDHKISQDKSN